ncbi:MAG: response regulator [Microthrixaceae bacterium]|nr:response regulator [Microthrixaceae bacterium]
MLKRSRSNSHHQPRRGGPPRVLVVDDNPDSATLLANLLRRGGYEVAEVGDANLALAVLPKEDSVSGVISHFSVAGAGASLKLLDSIRSHSNPAVHEQRVLLISDQSRQTVFAWQAGVDATLLSPYHEFDLLAALREMIERPHTDRMAFRKRQIAQLVRGDREAHAVETPRAVFR